STQNQASRKADRAECRAQVNRARAVSDLDHMVAGGDHDAHERAVSLIEARRHSIHRCSPAREMGIAYDEHSGARRADFHSDFVNLGHGVFGGALARASFQSWWPDLSGEQEGFAPGIKVGALHQAARRVPVLSQARAGNEPGTRIGVGVAEYLQASRIS